MREIRHMCSDIRGMLEYYRRRKMTKVFKDAVTGRSLSDSEARDFLYDCLAKGWKVIPLAPCDNFDYQEGCKGHPVPDEAQEGKP